MSLVHRLNLRVWWRIFPLTILLTGADAMAQIPPPTINGPATSTGEFVVSWSGSRSDMSRLQEREKGGQWRVIYRGRKQSRSFEKENGEYFYRAATCIETDDPGTADYQVICSEYSNELSVKVQADIWVTDEGRTVTSDYEILSDMHPDADKDGLSDTWELRVAKLTRPQVRLDEEEDWIDHPEHHVVDFVRVVGIKNECETIPNSGSSARKNISGPRNSSSRTFTLELGGGTVEVEEWHCENGWKRAYKGRRASLTLTRPDGTYTYRARMCIPAEPGIEEQCRQWGSNHTVRVDDPNSFGFVAITHVFAWSRDYGRLQLNAHNGDTEVVAMLWEVTSPKRIELRYVYTSAHAGSSTDHSGVWKATGSSCNSGRIHNLEGGSSLESMCIDSLQYVDNRVRVRSSEDKHAFYPRKHVCEEVTLVSLTGIDVGEDCGDGVMMNQHRAIKVINVGEDWSSESKLVDDLSLLDELNGVFSDESVWASSGVFCGGLGEGVCPPSIGIKSVPPPWLLRAADFCCAEPGPYRRVCVGPWYRCLWLRMERTMGREPAPMAPDAHRTAVPEAMD